MKTSFLVIAGVGLVLSVSADLLLQGTEAHGETWWSSVPGFFAVFGLVACVAIIVVAKLLGHYWLERAEDYYTQEDTDG